MDTKWSWKIINHIFFYYNAIIKHAGRFVWFYKIKQEGWRFEKQNVFVNAIKQHIISKRSKDYRLKIIKDIIQILALKEIYSY